MQNKRQKGENGVGRMEHSDRGYQLNSQKVFFFLAIVWGFRKWCDIAQINSMILNFSSTFQVNLSIKICKMNICDN